MRQAIFNSTFFKASLILIAWFITFRSHAQTDSLPICGATAGYFASLAMDGSGEPLGTSAPATPAPSFAPGAIMHCGSFDVYFEDVNSSTGHGFDDHTYVGGVRLDTIRRNTFCAVLSYIQSQFDFTTHVTSGNIRIYVAHSLDPVTNPAVPGDMFFAYGGPYYTATSPGITAGWLNQYATTGVDPAPSTQYHAHMLVNFDRTINPYGAIAPILWQNDYLSDTNCHLDLYSTLLHEMTHAMGWISFVRFGTAIPGGSACGCVYKYTPAVYDSIVSDTGISAHLFTRLDTAITASPVGVQSPTALHPLIVYSGSLYSINPAAYHAMNNYWLNASAAPYNHPVFSGVSYDAFDSINVQSFLSHLDDQQYSYSFRQRVSPGDRTGYIMGPYGTPGAYRRTYSKGEAQMLVRTLGYTYIGGTSVISNHIPYSKKMSNYGITPTTYRDFSEVTPPDYTITNNTGTTLTINLSDTAFTTADLFDADGDTITIDTTTIVNFRGCGVGGNNHAGLSWTGAHPTTITYTPRANFYGKAQFGFNLYDGHERGAFRVVTIEVKRGTHVSLSLAGGNMVCNGGFEEGSEVATAGQDKITNAYISNQGLYEGKWQGINFSDSHPYCFHSHDFYTNPAFTYWVAAQYCGSVIYNTLMGCSDTVYTNPTGDGSLSTSNTLYTEYDNPAPIPTTGGNRYQKFQYAGALGESYYNLDTDITQCNHFILSFDIYKSNDYYNAVVCPSCNASMIIKFADTVNIAAPVFNYSLPVHVFPMTTGTWQRDTLSFWYCGNPSHIMYFNSTNSGDFSIDNIALVPDPSPPPMAITLADTSIGSCQFRLYAATFTDTGCTPTHYLWSGSSLSCTTCASPIATPTAVAVYTLTVTDKCGTRSATATVTVNPLVPAIGGSPVVCVGSTTTLTDSTTGGVWSSSTTAVATIGSSSGLLTGVAVGTSVITYTLRTGCYTTVMATVIALPAAITGPSIACVGLTTTLSDATTGGTWSSADTTIATVGAGTGIVTGVATGTTTITYKVGTGCYVTKAITVDPVPTAITGTFALCVGSVTTLSDVTSGGTWKSSDTTIAKVGSGTGIVTGIAAGIATISYVLGTGCYALVLVTVNANPVITGAGTVCIGMADTLAASISGGTWVSSNIAVAAVGSSSGIVTGIASGRDTITYTATTGCIGAMVITVNPLPAAISGASSVCVGSATTLTDATGGGTWSSSNTAIGSVGSATGVVTGVAAGTVNITYKLPTGCYSVTAITVNPLPAAIAGTLTVCIGATTKLTDGTGGGTWSSSNTTIATVGTGGIVTGVATGTDTIYYALGTGCFTAVVVTVNPLPAAIGGTTTVCVGSTTTLTDATTGGVWSSSNTLIATVGSSSGVISGVAAGTAAITYTLGTGCFTTVTATVIPLPKPITGIMVICAGATTTLNDGTSGGTWSSSNTAIATIGSSSGIATGVGSGTVTISYTLGTGCFSIAVLTVNPLPTAISGSPYVCVALTETLTDATGGGTWTSDNTAVATIGSGSGLVTGVAVGTAGITYTLPTGCYASMAMTVITAPATIIGTPLTICPGSTTTLSDAIPGGSWSSSSGAIATVGTGGIVFGVASGTATITYSLGGSCYSTVGITVNPAPTAFFVVGGGAYCTGSPVVHVGLSGSQAGVKYQLYLGGSGVGSPVTGTGLALDFGVMTAPGIYTVTATDTVTGCTNVMTGSATVAINPLPSPINGPSGVCLGYTMTLTDTTSGGTWSSSTPTIATVGVGTGIVTGVALGTDTIRYTVTGTGCSQIKLITVNPLPNPITGLVNLCHAIPLTLHDATGGGTWSSTNTRIATIGSTSGIVTWDSVGVDTIMYRITSTGCGAMTVIKAWDTTCSPCNAFGDSFTVIGNSGLITSNLGRGNYYIGNNVTVRNTDTFTNAIIMIGAGDSIIIDTTCMLTVDSSHLFSLCNEWACMKLKPGVTHSGRLAVLSHSLIEDAMCGVYIPNAVTPSSGFIFKSEASIFNRNAIGIFIQNYKPAIAGYPFLVHNTAFISRDLQTGNPGFPKQWPPTLGIGGLKNYWNPGDTFATPLNIDDTTPGLGYTYPGVWCYGSIIPVNGIRLDGVGANLLPERYTGEPIPSSYYEIVIGDTTTADSNRNQNLFDGLQYGIYAVNSNLTSINNFYADLFSSNVYTVGGTSRMGGDGIFAGATDDVANQCRLRVYTPPGAQYNNRFYNFNNGVECSNMFQLIGQNTFMMNKNFGTRYGPPMGTSGYYISTAKYDSILIDYDTITNVLNGIGVWMAYDPTVTISHGGTLDTIPSQYMGLCNIDSNLLQIHPVWTAPLTTQQMNMGISYQNTVMMPPSSDTVYNSNLNINYNTIHDANNGIYVNGYWAPKGVEPYTSANTVYLHQQATSRPQYGINNTNCQNARVYYNNVSGTMPYSDTTNMMRAFYAASNSLMDLGCNDESQIGRGYEFYLTSPGMEWHSNNMTDNAKGMVLNGAVIGPQHIGLTTMNNAWYGTWSASMLQTYVYNGANALTSPFWVAGTTLTDPTNNVGSPVTHAYALGTSILVLPTTSIAPCLPIYGGSLTDTSNLLSQIAMQHVDYTLNIVPSNWMGQYSLWKTALLDSTIADSSAVVAEFVHLADSLSRFKYITSIETALAVGDLATANSLLGLNIDSMTNTATDSTTQVKMGDDTTADNIVQNYQSFYKLYLKYVTATMDSTDTLSILALAQLCPERNGAAVFQARALYSYIYNDLSMFNDDSCLSTDTSYIASRHSANHPVIISGESSQHYALFPNPNDGSFTLQQSVADINPVEVKVYDEIGRVIYSDRLQFVFTRTNMTIGNYAPGLYLLEIKDNQNRIFRFKFVKDK